MSGDPVSKARQLYHTMLGWTIIIAVVGGGSWFTWAAYRANPERRLAGQWYFEETSRQNAGQAGGLVLDFAGKTIRASDPSGAVVYSFDWTTYRYSFSDGEFPINLMLMKTASDLDPFVTVSLSPDETRMLFRTADEGPTRAYEFSRFPSATTAAGVRRSATQTVPRSASTQDSRTKPVVMPNFMPRVPGQKDSEPPGTPIFLPRVDSNF